MLYCDWDPIGVSQIPGAPANEYDRYADRVCALLMDDRATAEAIAAYLYEVSTASMGLSGHERLAEKANRVATKLVSLRAEMEKPTPYELGKHLFGRDLGGPADLAENHDKNGRGSFGGGVLGVLRFVTQMQVP